MELTWSAVKEVLFAVGSVAGVLALLRTVFEARLQRDTSRVERIKKMVNEQRLVDLEGRIYANREVPADDFEPFDQLAHERRTNQEVVRFTGPTSRALTEQLEVLLASYAKLREYIQVNEWEPRTQTVDGVEYRSWIFNKGAFEDQSEIARNYAKHLDEAAEQALNMRLAFQRFQLVAELHLLEVPLAKWLLPRRFKTHGL